MMRKRTPLFHSKTFLTKVGSGKTILKLRKKQIVFSQGDAADAVFYIQEGKVKLAEDQPGNAGRNGRHHSVEDQFVYE